jgi:predicted metal-dependent peptidase
MQFEKMCKRLLIREPFYGLIMLGIDKIHTTKVPTAAVAKSGLGVALLINDTFWESLNETQQEAILLHEVHHLCFNHLVMSADLKTVTCLTKLLTLR